MHSGQSLPQDANGTNRINFKLDFTRPDSHHQIDSTFRNSQIPRSPKIVKYLVNHEFESK